MNHELKSHYLYGFKDGLEIGLEKGMELAAAWKDCPANSEVKMVESLPNPEIIG